LKPFNKLYQNGKASDPREELTKRLCMYIPTDMTVLTYNMIFEKGVLQRLAEEHGAKSC